MTVQEKLEKIVIAMEEWSERIKEVVEATELINIEDIEEFVINHEVTKAAKAIVREYAEELNIDTKRIEVEYDYYTDTATYQLYYYDGTTIGNALNEPTVELGYSPMAYTLIVHHDGGYSLAGPNEEYYNYHREAAKSVAPIVEYADADMEYERCAWEDMVLIARDSDTGAAYVVRCQNNDIYDIVDVSELEE